MKQETPLESLAAEVDRANKVAAMFENVHPKARLNTKLAATYMNFAEQTLAQWRYEGGGPPFAKSGGGVVYVVEELDRFMAGRKRTTTAVGAAQPTNQPRRKRAPRSGAAVA